MSFITRQKRVIALITAFSFFYLIGIASLPLAAVDSASAERQPGAIEKTGSGGAHAAKKSPLIPILIGVAAAGAVAAVLFLVVLKSSYNIVDTWTGPFGSDTSTHQWTVTITFAGDKKSGTFTYHDSDGWDETGTYAVDGKDVTFAFDSEEDPIQFTGSFSDKDHMNGTWLHVPVGATGTWTLSRGATITAFTPIDSPLTAASPFKKR